MQNYLHVPKDWEPESSDYSVGIMATSMTHETCVDKENGGESIIMASDATGLLVAGGYERVVEYWSCLDCGRNQKFLVDEYIGWDMPSSEGETILVKQGRLHIVIGLVLIVIGFAVLAYWALEGPTVYNSVPFLGAALVGVGIIVNRRSIHE